MNKLLATLIAVAFAGTTMTVMAADMAKDAPKAAPAAPAAAPAKADAPKAMTKEEKKAIVTDEIISTLRQIKTEETDPTKVDRIAGVLSKLDDNKDGKIKIDDLLKVIELIGRENVKMTGKQLDEIVSTLAKEETLEEEVKTKKEIKPHSSS